MKSTRMWSYKTGHLRGAFIMMWRHWFLVPSWNTSSSTSNTSNMHRSSRSESLISSNLFHFQSMRSGASRWPKRLECVLKITSCRSPMVSCALILIEKRDRTPKSWQFNRGWWGFGMVGIRDRESLDGKLASWQPCFDLAHWSVTTRVVTYWPLYSWRYVQGLYKDAQNLSIRTGVSPNLSSE